MTFGKRSARNLSTHNTKLEHRVLSLNALGIQLGSRNHLNWRLLPEYVHGSGCIVTCCVSLLIGRAGDATIVRSSS
jgi:hypothetical protein